jgi:hypothetical protein
VTCPEIANDWPRAEQITNAHARLAALLGTGLTDLTRRPKDLEHRRSGNAGAHPCLPVDQPTPGPTTRPEDHILTVGKDQGWCTANLSRPTSLAALAQTQRRNSNATAERRQRLVMRSPLR